MAYDRNLADRIRAFLANTSGLEIEEKKMFGGLAFMINGKMCVNVSEENMMCRFDPLLQDEISAKKGFQPMIMKRHGFEVVGEIQSGSSPVLRPMLRRAR